MRVRVAMMMLVMAMTLMVTMVMLCYHLGALAWCQAPCKLYVHCIGSITPPHHR